MQIQTIALSLLAGVAGVAVALQPAANSGLSSRTGLSTALVVNTTVVLIGTLLFYFFDVFVRGETRSNFFPNGTPWYLYIGGVCGFVVIAITTMVFPKIGAGYAVALMVFGQGLAALLIDHYGWLAMPPRSLTLSRIVGLALVGAGALLLRQKSESALSTAIMACFLESVG